MNTKFTDLVRSSGIRGGCQSVVKRTESGHALSLERRAAALRRNNTDARFRESPLGCRAFSHSCPQLFDFSNRKFNRTHGNNLSSEMFSEQGGFVPTICSGPHAVTVEKRRSISPGCHQKQANSLGNNVCVTFLQNFLETYHP
jgi:hypothetical protein